MNKYFLLAPLTAATLFFAGARCETSDTTPTTVPTTPTVTATATARPEIGHKTGAADVVFRYLVENYLGPFPPFELTYDRVVLYGDGRLLIKDTDFGPNPQAGDRYTEIQLTEAGVQRLLAAIVNEGKLLDQPERSNAPGQAVADAGDPHFLLAIDQGTADTVANCLGCETNPADLRARLNNLNETLGALDASWFDPAEVVSEGPYGPDAIKVYAFPAFDGGPAAAPAWPLGIEQPKVNEGGLAGGTVLCGADATAVRALLDGTGSGVVTLTDGAATVRYRPVMPDEEGCAATGA